MTSSRVAEFQAIITSLALEESGGTWVRAIPLQYLSAPPPGSPEDALPNPLWPGGTHLTEARFIPKAMCDAYHISESISTALAEAERLPESIVDPVFGVPRADLALLRVDWRLTAVLNLCDAAVQDALAVTEEDLVSLTSLLDVLDQTHNPAAETLTQQIGRAAYRDPRIAAILYPSARRRTGRNIVVFTDRLTPESGQFLQTQDATRNRIWRLPPTAVSPW